MTATLALDVGTKRIGVAVSDPGGTYAIPLATIVRTNVRADLARIVDLAAEHASGEIVVGDPITLRGERGPAAQKIDAFVEELRRVFGGTIHRVDERMTTAQATKVMIAANASRNRRKQAVDMMAAALILETFLARRRS
ncbi:MAG: Holliday junction resolvase RuvX [Candidatus Tyrphobacter sp.]